METVRLLKERFPTLQDPPSDDICYATTNRQVAIKKISPQADLVIVVGSANSSNSVRLVEVALEYGAKASYRVDFANEVDEAWFEGVATVGVTSGASVPEVLVKDVLRLLADYGYGSVEEVVTAEEDLLFSLPKELRATLKQAGDVTRALGGRGTRPAVLAARSSWTPGPTAVSGRDAPLGAPAARLRLPAHSAGCSSGAATDRGVTSTAGGRHQPGSVQGVELPAPWAGRGPQGCRPSSCSGPPRSSATTPAW